MFRRQLVRVLTATVLTVCLVVAGLPVQAATACPDMPKGADNLFDADTMQVVGTGALAIYENETLLLQPRNGVDPAYGYMVASFDLPDSLASSSTGFVIRFWTRLSTSWSDGTDGLHMRFLDAGSGDYFGDYYDILFQRSKAILYRGRGEQANLALPSTGKCLGSSEDTSVMGDWKEISIYLKPTGNQYALSVFVDREAMADDGVDTITLDKMDLCLMFGFQNQSATVRGIRVYQVDPAATAFEPAFEPNAEFDNAENGTAGADGGNGGVTLLGDAADSDTATDGAADDSPSHQADSDSPGLLPLILGIGGGVLVLAGAIIAFILIKRKPAPAATDDKEVDDDEKV